MKKIKIRVKFESGKKFYESDYKDIYNCYKASERDAIKKFRKKYPGAIIYDVFSRGRDCDSIAGRYIEEDYHYITWIRGFFYLPSKANYRRALKMGKIKLR